MSLINDALKKAQHERSSAIAAPPMVGRNLDRTTDTKTVPLLKIALVGLVLVTVLSGAISLLVVGLFNPNRIPSEDLFPTPQTPFVSGWLFMTTGTFLRIGGKFRLKFRAKGIVDFVYHPKGFLPFIVFCKFGDRKDPSLHDIPVKRNPIIDDSF